MLKQLKWQRKWLLMNNTEIIREKIRASHLDDVEQTNIIFDDAKRIIVEAPAGCGKTKTMISKIAYLLVSNKLESTKKILALTFSVNAAYKIKKDVLEQLPIINNCKETESLNLTDRITVSNYHGFCRKILSKYGHLITDRSIDFKTIQAIPDTIHNLRSRGLKENEINYITEFSVKIKSNQSEYIEQNYIQYNSYIKDKLLSQGVITYDGILLLAYELFKSNIKLRNFYQKIYPIIFVDEFQDTNCISWLIIKELISEDSNVVFMGDSLQRIYGFIGAVPNLMVNAEKELNMRKFILKTNYRFKNNSEMLILDNNVRLNAKKINSEEIIKMSNPNIILADSQTLECEWICNKVNEIKNAGKVAILTRNGIVSPNTKMIKEKLDFFGIEYFFALFSDEDSDYIEFHEKALKIFDSVIVDKKTITRKMADKFIEKLTLIYVNGNNIQLSLIKLTKVFLNKFFDEYKKFSVEEKISLVRETLENRALRQNMDKIDENVVLSTIHASKGLEFSNVIIADNEDNNIPTFFTCRDCKAENKTAYCVKQFESSNESLFLEELSIFYVGFTRARNNVYFTLSKIDAQNYERIPSCFLKLKGIGRNNIITIKQTD